MDNDKEIMTSNSGRDELINPEFLNRVGSLSPQILEVIFAERRRLMEEERRIEYLKALNAAQKRIKPVLKVKPVKYKTKQGGVVEYKYAPLEEIVKNILPIFTEHGFSATWKTESIAENELKVTCILSHQSGHAQEATLSGKYTHDDIKALGALESYLRRYTIAPLLGIAFEDEDDELMLSNQDSEVTEPEYISDAEVKQIYQLMAETGINEKRFIEYLGVPSIADIPKNRLSEVMNLINARRERQQRGGK